jgi:4-aminobutyrate aminotransferase
MKSQPYIKVEPPGPNARKIIDKDHKFIATTTKTSHLAVKSGKGVFLEDADGNTFLDFTSGVGVLNIGQNHPKVVSAIKKQAGLFLHFAGTDFYYEAQAKLSETLANLALC